MDQTPDMNQLIRLSQSPAGRQLLQLLLRQGGKELEAAAQKAAAGDYTQAKAAISHLMETPEAKELLKQLEDRK